MIERGGSKASRVWIVVVVLSVRVATAQFAGGTGTRDDPYQIATAKQLLSIASDRALLSKHYLLINDIDLDPKKPGGKVFTQAPIAPDIAGSGDGYWHPRPFVGTFNGCGYVIRKLTIQGNGHFLGLFGGVSWSGRITDLGVEEVDIRGGPRAATVGGLVGQNFAGLIANCHVTGRISVGDKAEQIGGLVGQGGFLLNCYATASVTAGASARRVAGLVGEGGNIVGCWTTGNVTVGDSWCSEIGGLAGWGGGYIALCWAGGSVSGGAGCTKAGGLVGFHNWGDIVNSCATGNVQVGTKAGEVGGLVGDTSATAVSNCFSIGKVTAGGMSNMVGGLVGGRVDVVDHCFWDKQTSGLSGGGAGTGLTTSAMRQARTFQAAGWDWVGETANGTAELWMIPAAGGYPVLTVFSPEYQRHGLDGRGTPGDPYILFSAEDLGALCHYDRSLSYKLAADIDLAGITWATAPIPDFYGSFDGNGFVLSHLTIEGAACLALFNGLGESAAVTSLGIVDANITVQSRGVAVLAVGSGAAISDCRVTGTITQRFAADRMGRPPQVVGTFGGLVGSNSGDITRCAAAVGISVGDNVQSLGGLAGANYRRIAQSFAVTDLRAGARAQSVGGLVGVEGDSDDRLVTDCYALGSLAAGDNSKYVGGLVGRCQGRVVNSYAAVSIAAGDKSEFLYGLSGCEGSVTKSFWNVEISGLTTSPCATGLTTTQMHAVAPFRAAGWDFKNTWTICEGKDYPRLQWEGVACE